VKIWTARAPGMPIPGAAPPAGQHTKRQRSLPNRKVVMYHCEKEPKECSLIWDSAT